MNIKPVRKVNKSSDKKQKQHDKKQNPRKFLEKFTKKLNKYRKPEITKSNQATTQKKYKSKSFHNDIYKREFEKNKSYSKVYNKLNDKKDTSKKKKIPQKQNINSQTVRKETQKVSKQTVEKNNTNNGHKKTISYGKTTAASSGFHSTRLRYSGSRAYSSTRRSHYSSERKQSLARRSYYNQRPYVTSKSNSTTKKAYNTTKSQVRRTTKPQSSKNTKKIQSSTTKKQPQRVKTQSTVKRTQTKNTRGVSTKTNTSRSQYTSKTPQRPQQLITSVQKQGKASKKPTKSIERMLDEYSQAYKKPKAPARTITSQKSKSALPQARGRKQPLTKKEEVREFKKGIASTKTRTNNIAYIEYQKSLNKRAAMQRRMNNRDNRER